MNSEEVEAKTSSATEDQYLNLATTIVEQTVIDYEFYVKKLLKNKASGDLEKRREILAHIKALSKWFDSSWANTLGVENKKHILKLANERARKKKRRNRRREGVNS